MLDEAIVEFRDAIRLIPDLPAAHINLGNALRKQGKLDEATAECRTALRLKPHYVEAHVNLGLALADHGKLDEAVAELREAIRLKPDDAEAHNGLGIALYNQGKRDEAIAEYRESLRIKANNAEVHRNIGIALMDIGDLDKAITAFNEALRHKPDFADARCGLGHVLSQQSRYAEALAEFKRGHELGSNNRNWHYPSADWVRHTERLVALDTKLPAILNGRDKPSDALEWLGFAQLCYQKKLHGASSRFWTEAFQAQPNLADDMNVQNRYNAACAAALAGSGQGKDDPPLDEEKKARWRKQAVDWLKADLTAWSKILDGGSPQSRQAITQTLEHWKADTDLAGLRDAAPLAKLPDSEEKACRALWAEVDALLAKSGKAKPH